jgi:hypothetical protein
VDLKPAGTPPSLTLALGQDAPLPFPIEDRNSDVEAEG